MPRGPKPAAEHFFLSVSIDPEWEPDTEDIYPPPAQMTVSCERAGCDWYFVLPESLSIAHLHSVIDSHKHHNAAHLALQEEARVRKSAQELTRRART